MTEESVCVVCEQRPAQPGSLWCGGCFARCHAELSDVAYAHWWLGRQIETPAAAWKAGAIGGEGGSRPPFRVDLTDVRVQIELLLRIWSRYILSDRRGIYSRIDGDWCSVHRRINDNQLPATLRERRDRADNVLGGGYGNRR